MAVTVSSIDRIPTSNDEVIITFSNGAQQLARAIYEESGIWIILSSSSKLVIINPDMECKVLSERVTIR